MNLYEIFRERWRARADAPAFAPPGRPVVTYGALDELAARIAAVLIDAGLEPGERVLAQVDKSVEAVALYLGALRAGGVFTPLNTAYTANEVAFFLKDARPRAFFCRPGTKDALAGAAAQAGASLVEAFSSEPENAFRRRVAGTAPLGGVAARDASDLASILYTSGTTGRSKGAMLSHGALAANARALCEVWGLRESDVLLHALPVFHIHGLFVALHTAFLNASKVIFLDRFDPAELRRHLGEATILMGVPTFYTRLLDDGLTREECAHMRLFISGSAPLTEEASNAFEARTGFRILERYGMSEAGIIASNPLEGERIPGSVGYALPGVEIRIADDSGKALPRGQAGSVEIRGASLFSGYWGLPEKTAEEMRPDGFFITGDVGTMAQDGRLRLVGRAKDLIISGGYNIYPKEIEAVLDAVPGVRESAVIGAPHADLGEGVVAVLVAERAPVDEAALKSALDATLARFKHPRRFYWEKELPRNAMGKVQKAQLREKYKGAYKA
ncbi:MAG: AMP-binding protein [Alphaproteobacteria bacterium]|nr:AMP-binding protein [Alphaproteobacteria bacterium]